MDNYPTSNATPTVPVPGLEDFFIQYTHCALWTATDEHCNPLDSYGLADIHHTSRDAMREDCLDFLTSNRHLIPEGEEGRAGHDFWLTRNRHGAGFWDGDWSEDAGRALTDAAHAYGSCDLYLGDDGMIHAS